MDPHDPAAPYVPDHTDYAARVVPLRRWHPDRGAAESTGMTGDARADESLYRPSLLGTVESSLETVPAGRDTPFSLTYRTGAHTLGPGTSVHYFMAGQGSLGTSPQIEDSSRPGYLELEGPKGVELELHCAPYRALSVSRGENPPGGPDQGDILAGPIDFGFRIASGRLHERDAVRIHLGRSAGFPWKRLAGRKEFKVIIDPGNGNPRMRLPEPVLIRILPLAAERIEALLPATHRSGGWFRASVSLRDRYDNRVPRDAAIKLRAGGRIYRVHLHRGIGEAKIYSPAGRSKPRRASPAACAQIPECALQIRARMRTIPTEAVSNWSLGVSEGSGRLFFGDLHSHDAGSTAEGYPEDVYRWAREEKRLDFLSVPLQVHRYIDNEKWLLAKHMAEYFLEEGRFVTFPAFEWQHSHYGDKVIHFLGGDPPYLPIDDPRYADPGSLYAALKSSDALIVSHHPGYAADLHVPGTDWRVMDTEIDRLVEIWSMHGSSEGYDPEDRPLIPPCRPEGALAGLRRGLRFGLVAGSDSHTGRPGGSAQDVRPYWGGLCAVWAEQLSRRAIFTALKARRTYALTGARIILLFSVNGAFMGSEIPFTPRRLLCVQVWAPAAVSRLQFLCNGELIHETHPAERVCGANFEHERTAPPEEPQASGQHRGSGQPHASSHSRAVAHPRGDFYHCRVVQEDGELAVCSPVWVG